MVDTSGSMEIDHIPLYNSIGLSIRVSGRHIQFKNRVLTESNPS